MKKCGLDAVKAVMPEEHMKLLTNIRKVTSIVLCCIILKLQRWNISFSLLPYLLLLSTCYIQINERKMRKAKSSEDGDAMSLASGVTRYYGVVVP